MPSAPHFLARLFLVLSITGLVFHAEADIFGEALHKCLRSCVGDCCEERCGYMACIKQNTTVKVVGGGVMLEMEDPGAWSGAMAACMHMIDLLRHCNTTPGTKSEKRPDADNDGWWDEIDDCPQDPYKHKEGRCGCGVRDIDSDRDGSYDCRDQCPNDPLKQIPGFCGCNHTEHDSDGDYVPDCVDECPEDPAKAKKGVCGCNRADVDNDGDGRPDCIDDTPLNAPADRDGDGIDDARDFCFGENSSGDSDGDRVCDDRDRCRGIDWSGDDDGDGVCNSDDRCPTSPKSEPGVCGCERPEIDNDGDRICDRDDRCQGDNASGDKDNDGVCDDLDPCPLDKPDDRDNDGICDSADECYGDNSSGDSDGDRVCDSHDKCRGDDRVSPCQPRDSESTSPADPGDGNKCTVSENQRESLHAQLDRKWKVGDQRGPWYNAACKPLYSGCILWASGPAKTLRARIRNACTAADLARIRWWFGCLDRTILAKDREGAAQCMNQDPPVSGGAHSPNSGLSATESGSSESSQGRRELHIEVEVDENYERFKGDRVIIDRHPRGVTFRRISATQQYQHKWTLHGMPEFLEPGDEFELMLRGAASGTSSAAGGSYGSTHLEFGPGFEVLNADQLPRGFKVAVGVAQQGKPPSKQWQNRVHLERFKVRYTGTKGPATIDFRIGVGSGDRRVALYQFD